MLKQLGEARAEDWRAPGLAVPAPRLEEVVARLDPAVHLTAAVAVPRSGSCGASEGAIGLGGELGVTAQTIEAAVDPPDSGVARRELGNAGLDRLSLLYTEVRRCRHLACAAVGGGIYGFKQAKLRVKPFQHFLERLSLKFPIFGDILVKATIARFARTLSTMFAAGVPLVEAMDSVAGAAGNIVYGTATYGMRDKIATGTQLQVAMRETKLFPNMVVQMVAIGEESGSIDSMLSKVADFYEEEVDNAVDAMSSLMEPLIMAVLGVLIGGLVIAMYLPIFKLGQVV